MGQPEGFGIHTRTAWDVAERLGRIKDNMNGMERRFTDTNTGSPRLDRALTDFIRKSSDHRKRTNELLTKTANLLEKVVTEARRTDVGLAKGLEGKKEGTRA